jgi:RimJ/RimL family protein N-acetyltransferase
MHPPDSPLRDDAVLLRPWVPEDVDAVVDGFGHPSVTQWFPVEVPFTKAAASAFVEAAGAAWLADECATFAVIDVETGVAVGGVDVDEIDWAARSGDVGYWLAASARGRGLATRAVRLVARWALADLGLTRLTLLAEPENTASLAVATRTGFRREYGTVADTDWRDGRRREFVVFSVVATRDGA